VLKEVQANDTGHHIEHFIFILSSINTEIFVQLG